MCAVQYAVSMMAAEAGRHRPLSDLATGVLGTIRRNARALAVVTAAAIVSVIVAVVSVSAIDTAAAAVIDIPEAEILLEALSDDGLSEQELSELFSDWADAADISAAVAAVVLFAASQLLWLLLMLWLSAAVSLVAVADAEGGPQMSLSTVVRMAAARSFKAALLTVVYAAAFLAAVAALVAVVAVSAFVHPVLAVLAGLCGVAGLLTAAAFVLPLAQIHYVIAYAEPGVPSVSRWRELLSGAAAATWARSTLLILVVAAVYVMMLPAEWYGGYALTALMEPIVTSAFAVAYALMYADLSGRVRPSGSPRLLEAGTAPAAA